MIVQFVKSLEFGNYCRDNGVNYIEEGSRAYRERNAGVTAFVNRLYKLLLGRAGEPQGLEYWCRLLIEKERTGSQVAKGFVESKELGQRGLSDSEYVTLLYRSILGREPDSKGMEDWTACLKDGTGRDTIFKGFANSVEFSELCSRYGIMAK